MISDWIFEDNLRAFLHILGWLVDYEITLEEIFVIEDSVRQTDAELNHWYDFELNGKQGLKCSLAIDPGTSVVHIRLKTSADLTPQIEMAVAIFSRFHLHPIN